MRKKRKVTDIIFKLEHQFTLYLQRCEITAADLSADQYREMRRAFYGGLGQMFFLVSQDVPDLGNDRTMGVMMSLIQNQIMDFWVEEQKAQVAGLSEIHPTMPVKCMCGWEGKVMELQKPKELGGPSSCPQCSSEQLYF